MPKFQSRSLSQSRSALPEKPHFDYETNLKNQNIWPIAGLDEAGRGPLAGPVVASAVILDENNIPPGLNDSKKLSCKKREILFEQILKSSYVAIGINSPQYIDIFNIRQASLNAMKKALLALPVKAGYALIDGIDIPCGLNIAADALKKGDGKSLSIAAASIIAKVTRDRMMKRISLFYPEYGFDKHVGYGTKAHREAIAEYGPCPIHRMSFRPIRLD